MTSEIGGNVPNPLLNLNPMALWQNYLTYWIGMSRNFYENAISTNEQWLKALWDTWLKVGNLSQRETVKM
ncbi:MAG: hypothetical protein WA364_02500 [Candidatus Nitrosopolaris sp.]